MENHYTTPEAEVVLLSKADVITLSDGGNDDDTNWDPFQ